MKTKKGDLLNLWYILEGMKHQKQNVKFSYFVAKNKISIKGEFEALNEAQEAPETFKLYDTKRADLAAELADRIPETEEPMTKNGQYVIELNKKKFDKQLDKLKEDYGEVIKQREEQVESFKELLDEETEFKGHKIKFGDIPDTIEPSVMEVLLLTGLVF